MFHRIPKPVADRMRYLEELDQKNQAEGLSGPLSLMQVPRETGKLLALLASTTPEGEWIEIGTSAGYSTLWLSQACRLLGRSITTHEVLPEKMEMARETFRLAEVEDVVRLVPGDAVKAIAGYENISFCFLDAAKDIYAECYEIVVPKMVKGGILVADNTINCRRTLEPMIERALGDERVDAVDVQVGQGQLVCRKL